MTKPPKLLAKAMAKQTNLRFTDMIRLVEAFGFKLVRVSGSHHIYARDGVDELINLQNVKGQAKPYQVRQFLALVEGYNLVLGDDA